MDRELTKYLKIKHKVLYVLLYLVKHHKDMLLIKWVMGYKDNPNLIELSSGKRCPKVMPPVCFILVGDNKEGLCACLRWILDALFFCEHKGFLPLIELSNESLYHDDDMPKDINAFNYYFTDKCMADRALKMESTVIKYSIGRNGLLAESMNGGMQYEVSETYIKEMSEIMQKFIALNEETKKIIDEHLDKFKVSERMLGVHVRGTDYKMNYKNHPIYVKPESYYPYIDEALETCGFDKIYLATDDSEILDQFLKHYEGQVIYDDEVKRGIGKIGVHMGGSYEKYGHYQLGIEILKDMCALAACGGIISSMSQVALLARIKHKSQGSEYAYDYTINHGINERGKLFNKK